MVKTETLNLLAPGIGERILQYMNPQAMPAYVIVENLHESLSAMIEFEGSDDGVTWTTIVGSSKSISPGGADGQIVTSSYRRIALFAQGNVQLQITVIRRYSGENSDLF